MESKKNYKTSVAMKIEMLESRCMMSASDIVASTSLTIVADATSSSAISGYTPAQIKKAYGISSINLNGVTGDGTGQTIAIVDAYNDANIASDLATFDTAFSLSAPASFKQISQIGSTTLPKSDAGWDGEIALDVEWAHAIAPKANIVLVDATTDSLKNLMAAVKYASSISTVSVVSMSWGSSEFSTESSYDSYFTTPAGHIGITYVAASGDEGAAGGAEYPAVSPNVLAVGGTTLSIGSTGAVTSETAWSDSSGGTSTYEAASSVQATATGTTKAKSPDVSYDADPNTGFAVYDSVADDGYVGWEEVGGTSAGAPQWAALVAIADQERVAKGSSTLDGATGTLPAIYSVYSNATSYAADFTDITSGSSSLGGGGFGGGYGGPGGGGPGGRFGGFRQSTSVSATTGYDTLTGVGSPKAAALVSSLVSATVKSVAKVKATATIAASTAHAAKAIAFDVAQASERSNPVAARTPKTSLVPGKTLAASTIASPTSLSIDDVFTAEFGQTNNSVEVDVPLASVIPSISPLLLSTQSTEISIENTIRHTDEIIAKNIIMGSALTAATPLLEEPSVHTDSAVVAVIASDIRRKNNSSPAAAVTALAIIADGVVLGVYHARKRRSASRPKGRESGNLFSNTVIA